MQELSPKYDPKEVEERWYKLWEERNYFKADPASPKPAFCIVIPPPNVTGSLHIGHALNNSLQDLMARYKRMNGFDVLWLPGCDHAAIATQNVVERQLAKQGVTRHDLGREKFLQKVWEWKEESGATIMRQLRRLGASLDWSRERFTMDEGLVEAVREVFVRMYEKGLIYQGDYVVNWCPRCGTALSDIEVLHKESEGKLYYVRYPVAGFPGTHVVVATTRPETIMGDVAVCVNPKDPRYTGLKDARLTLPLMGREIPLIADSYVEMDFGTGALKITPAHDANDFEIGNRFGLPRIKIMDPKGVMNEAAGRYAGLDRFAARKKVVADLEAAGLLEKVEPYQNAVGRCYRCDTVVESYLSLQWFMKMKPMAEKALAAMEKGETRFQPENWKKVYSDWLLGIRDWCISRQIWWGHRIPIYYNADRSKQCAAHSVSEAALKLGVPETEVQQDPDTLDTWFSAGLWPFATLGWPKETPELKRYYPTSMLVTSWDILSFWVARMSMFGLEIMGKVPFEEVFINSLVADEHGQKMSKTKGNVIDPLTKIDTIGADALRFALISIETQSRYISLSEERFEAGRNFTNKIWNAARFMLMNLKGLPEGPITRPRQESLELADRWILTRLDDTVREVTRQIEEGRQVNQAANSLHDFFWHDLCDWYIEAAKARLAGPVEEGATARATLAYTLETTLRLLHPFCPFITEEIWQMLPHGEVPSIMLASWPQPGAASDPVAEADFKILSDIVYAVRNIRGEMKVDAKKQVTAILLAPDQATLSLLVAQKALLESLGQMTISGLSAGAFEKPKGAASAVAGAVQVFLPLEGLLDLAVERTRLEKEMGRFQQLIEAIHKKLGNEQFVSKAPASVVEAERKKIAEYQSAIDKLGANLKELPA
ncbi:MAG: valine--tRNA ligase [candidate division FCPU426 bacterium]